MFRGFAQDLRFARRPLAFPEPERLVQVWEVGPGGDDRNVVSPANLVDWREQTTAFQGLAARINQAITLVHDDGPREIRADFVSPNYVDVLGVRPLLGVIGGAVAVALVVAGHQLLLPQLVGQVAVATVLLIGAGLLARSLWELQRTDLGFQPEQVVTMRFSRVGALPGVVAVGSVNWLPLAGQHSRTSFAIEGAPEVPSSHRRHAVRRERVRPPNHRRGRRSSDFCVGSRQLGAGTPGDPGRSTRRHEE
jgi:hypothetical protein